MLVEDLRRSLTYSYPDAVASDAFDEHLRAALALYNRYNPLKKSAELSTVAGVADYTLGNGVDGQPEVFLYVSSVVWYPAYDPIYSMFDVESDPDVVAPASYYHEPSLRVIDRFKSMEMYRARMGGWEVRGQTIHLIPTPTLSGVSIYVEYYKAHELSSDGASLDTIPDGDFDVLRDLIIAEALDARALALSVEPNYAEGLQRVDRQFAIQATRNAAVERRMMALSKFSSNAVRSG